MPQILDDIGGEIDFVILDTKHILPGEVLDFIAVSPYLKNGAFVVLHDVRNCQSFVHFVDQHATAVLFGAVTAENIDNVFLILILRWSCLPPEEQIVACRRLCRKFYPAELCEIFQEAVDMNAFNIIRANRK